MQAKLVTPIRRTSENVSYQTTLTGSLISGEIEYLQRDNHVRSSSAGCNSKSFLKYYSVNGTDVMGQKPGSSNIIRESVFTKEANPALVAAYPAYRDYLLCEYRMQYPTAYGAALRDGKTNTRLAGVLRFVDIRGNSVARYPAIAAALDYGITINGATTGLEAGGWWLPSVDEVYLLMRDRVLTAADRERDPVNRTLARMNKTTCYGADYSLYTSCECNLSFAYFYNGSIGNVFNGVKYGKYFLRPVSSL